MKVGIFSPYFETFGGGERYMLSAAEFFQNRGDKVEVFWPSGNIEKVKNRFDLNLTGVTFVQNIFGQSLTRKIAATANYDLLFFLSDGSIPITFAKKNWLHFQVPMNFQASLADRLKIRKFDKVICNSKFTKKFIDQSYKLNTTVVYPPVDIDKFSPSKKVNVILTIGRFAKSNPKKHDVMIKTFKEMNLKNWKLVILGTALDEDLDEVDRLRKICSENIDIQSRVGFKSLRDYLGKAMIYWHATGFGEDLEEHPDRSEHFGITTVEAMSAGAIPVVFAGGGQLEIVEEEKNGYLWQTTEELKAKTFKAIKNPGLKNSSINASRRFSKQEFFKNLAQML